MTQQRNTYDFTISPQYCRSPSPSPRNGNKVFDFFPLKYELQAEARGFGEWLSLYTKKILSWAMRSLRVNYVNCNEDFRVYFTEQQK